MIDTACMPVHIRTGPACCRNDQPPQGRAMHDRTGRGTGGEGDRDKDPHRRIAGIEERERNVTASAVVHVPAYMARRVKLWARLDELSGSRKPAGGPPPQRGDLHD
jgi:hypothetical protein